MPFGHSECRYPGMAGYSCPSDFQGRGPGETRLHRWQKQRVRGGGELVLDCEITRYEKPLMVSLSNHMSGRKGPLMSFDRLRMSGLVANLVHANLRNQALVSRQAIGATCGGAGLALPLPYDSEWERWFPAPWGGGIRPERIPSATAWARFCACSFSMML
ncbi:MAG: hypothetical protein HW388_711 [Dehalococcoidia bacterium]|nr:hypothetical protein [Dehalococcoidia bacterium]